MKVIAKVLLNMKNEKFIGLAMNEDEMKNLHDIFSALQSSEPVPAEYILKFLWRDFTFSFDVIGPYFSLKSTIDHRIITETLFETLRVFHNYGFKTSRVVCDGASSNLAAIKFITTQKRGAYGSNDECDKHKVEPSFRNPFDATIEVYFIICPSHQVLIEPFQLYMMIYSVITSAPVCVDYKFPDTCSSFVPSLYSTSKATCSRE